MWFEQVKRQINCSEPIKVKRVVSAVYGASKALTEEETVAAAKVPTYRCKYNKYKNTNKLQDNAKNTTTKNTKYRNIKYKKTRGGNCCSWNGATFHVLPQSLILENSQKFFDKFEKSDDGSINQEEFMKALAEERNLVDILTQNGRCYQGMDIWKDPDFVSILKIIQIPRLVL